MELISPPLRNTWHGVEPRRVARLISLRKLVLWGALVATLALSATVKTAVVNGPSMAPTLQMGQRIVAAKLPFSLSDGDIVLIEDWNGAPYLVKRIYKSQGETVAGLYLPRFLPNEVHSYVVPADFVYVVGDNLTQSEDSRDFGAVPLDHVIGKVFAY